MLVMSHAAAVQEGRRARNAFVAMWNAAVEGHQAGAARPQVPEGVPAMQEVLGGEHRSRYAPAKARSSTRQRSTCPNTHRPVNVVYA